MGRRTRCAAAGLLLLLASACRPEQADPGPTERERLERYADDAPAVLVARVKDAYAKTVMRVSVSRLPGEQDPYTFVADQTTWRVETPRPDEEEGDGQATLLVTDDEVCFDGELQPALLQLVSMSYGFVDFDPQPWTCTPAEFGLNTLATHSYRRADPRWRIENLTTDPASATIEVEEVDG